MLRIFPVTLLLIGVCSASFGAIDSSLLALAPANSQVVAAINIDESRNSAFGQFLLRQLSTHDNDFQKLMEKTGFDPRRDLQYVMLTATAPQGSNTRDSFTVLARGSYDQSRIKTAAQQQGSIVQQFQGTDLLVGNHGKEQTAFAFLDVGLAVIGDLASIKQVIENRSNPATLDPALQNQINHIGMNDAWFASVMPASAFRANVDPSIKQQVDQAQILQSIVQASGGIGFGDTLGLVLNAEMRSTQDATSLADVVRFLASAMQMQRGKDTRATLLASAFDNMKLEVTGSAVHMALGLPESVLEQFATMPSKPARTTR